jgi:lipoprotein-anchoring transpeptidase ErfK/SrfK
MVAIKQISQGLHKRLWVGALLSGSLLLAADVTTIAQTNSAAPTTIPTASATPAPAPKVPTLGDKPGNVIMPPTPGAAAPTMTAPTTAATVEEPPVKLILKRKERRVYVYKGDKVVNKYPVAIGKPGWETPLGEFQVLTMELNPTFKSFKTGRIVPPGPDNPLGVRWIGIWTDGKTQLGFHGTNEPELIGQAVSHGCIRMYNKDVTKLYEQVKMGTTVTIVP